MNLTHNQKALLEVANTFLLKTPLTEEDFESAKDLTLKLQSEFQKTFSDYYIESGIDNEVTPIVHQHPGHHLDERILNLVASHSVHKNDENIPDIVRMFPKFHKTHKNPGMECTLANALLHVALEDTGHKNVRSTLVHGHWVLTRQLHDGAIKLYDASSYSKDKEGNIKGFVHTFHPSEIVGVKEVYEPTGENGLHFTVKTKKTIPGTQIFKEKDGDGFHSVKFYAFSEEIYLDLSIALRNLHVRQRDNLETNPPIPENYNFKDIKEELDLFDGYDHLFD